MLLSLGLLCYSKAWPPCHVPAPTVHLSLFTLGGVSGKGDASDEDDDNEFFDAMEDPAEFITVPADPKYHRFITPCFSNFIFKSCVVFIARVILSFKMYAFLFICPPGDLGATSAGSAVRLEWMISR